MTPTTDGAAMMVLIKLAFESMLDVVNVPETMLDEQFARLLGAIAAAANQYHGDTVVFG